MPLRNLAIIFLTLALAAACRLGMPTGRYARVLGESIDVIESLSLTKIGARQLFEGAMSGMTDKLDEYSAYLPPEDAKELIDELDAKFVGVGVYLSVDPQTKELVVTRPQPDSPAFAAGIRAGDMLERIAGKSAQGMSMDDASALLRGKPGEAVEVVIKRKGVEKPIVLSLVRAEIHIDSVYGLSRSADGSRNFMLPGIDGFAYVRIDNFAEGTVEELKNALKRIAAEKAKGLILDLRDNPGGLLPAACDVCKLFVSKGTIVSTRDRNGDVWDTIEVNGKNGGAPYPELPLVVLVNRLSASASEIVAACLQDDGRAVIVGERSFGKGTVQHVIELGDDLGVLKITAASYWRPSGKNIHRRPDAKESDEWGVTPDPGCGVSVNEEDMDKLRQQWVESEAGTVKTEAKEKKPPADRVLEKALEVLKKKGRSS